MLKVKLLEQSDKRLSVRLAIDIAYYRLNSAGFLVLRDMVQTFNIRKFFTQNNCFNNLQCIDEVAVSDLVYPSLAQNVS